METGKDAVIYRYFGTELRLVFYLAALFFLLLSVLRFQSSFSLSLVSFLIFVLISFLTYLDYKSHLLILDQDKLSLHTFFKSGEKSLTWKNVEKVITRESGIFDLLKATRITSEGKEIRVFSFMEDYYHFLKDICDRSMHAEIDKLTHDLVTGQADI